MKYILAGTKTFFHTSRKLTNIYRNIDGIFSSVICNEFYQQNISFLIHRKTSMKIFCQYIPSELHWKKNELKKVKKYNDVSFIQTTLPAILIHL
jgi:hypothetical protein